MLILTHLAFNNFNNRKTDNQNKIQFRLLVKLAIYFVSIVCCFTYDKWWKWNPVVNSIYHTWNHIKRLKY